MTIGNIVNAFGALSRLAAAELPVKQAYRISRMLTALEGDFRYFSQRRAKLIEQYPEPRTAEQNQALHAALDEIFAVTSDSAFVPVTLTEADCEGMRITSNDVSALNGFVIFEGMEDYT